MKGNKAGQPATIGKTARSCGSVEAEFDYTNGQCYRFFSMDSSTHFRCRHRILLPAMAKPASVAAGGWAAALTQLPSSPPPLRDSGQTFIEV